MFDAHKLDISDELKTVLDNLKPYHDKIKILLNKCDSIDYYSLLKVYGALLWNLGKVFNTPEVFKIYLSSFWNQPIKNINNNNIQHKLFLEKERNDLLLELYNLPSNTVMRKINEIVKRIRNIKVHSFIIYYLNCLLKINYLI